jgi:hypothetical protein
MEDIEVTVTKGGEDVELPTRLAKLLIDHKGWEIDGDDAEALKSVPQQALRAAPVPAKDDEPIQMTYIPGVVPGVTMQKVRDLVNSGAVPYITKGRSKLIKPSDVIAALQN